MDNASDLDVKELIKAIRARDDFAFSELVACYTPMINKVISGFHKSGMSFDEAFAEACVGLYRAALSYDLSKVEVTFGLYARICIYRRLCDFVGKDSNAELLLLEDFDVGSVGGSEAVESLLLGKEMMQKSLVRAKEILSDYEYKVFLLYLNGCSTAVISKELGKSPKSVDNAKARLFRRLRERSDTFPTLD